MVLAAPEPDEPSAVVVDNGRRVLVFEPGQVEFADGLVFDALLAVGGEQAQPSDEEAEIRASRRVEGSHDEGEIYPAWAEEGVLDAQDERDDPCALLFDDAERSRVPVSRDDDRGDPCVLSLGHGEV